MSTAAVSDEQTSQRRRAAEMPIGHVPNCAYRKWAERAPEWVSVDVVEAWHQGEPVHHPGAANGAVCRFHVQSAMLLLVRQGTLVSCYPISNRSRTEQQYIRDQVTDQ